MKRWIGSVLTFLLLQVAVSGGLHAQAPLAVLQAEEAAAAARADHGAGSPEYYRSLRVLADTQLRYGQYAQGLATLDKCLKVARRQYGLKSEAVQGLLRDALEAEMALAAYPQAHSTLEMLEQAGSRDLRPLKAEVLLRQGAYAHARDLCAQTLSSLDSSGQANGAHAVMPLQVLTGIAMAEHKDEEARALLRRTEPIPMTHMALIRYLLLLAEWERSFGEPATALQHARGALTLSERTYSAGHSALAAAELEMGYCLLDSGDEAAARAHLERVLELHQEQVGKRHDEVAYALGALGQIYRQEGRKAQAHAAFTEAITLLSEVAGTRHQRLALWHGQLGEMAMEDRDFRAALAHLEAKLSLDMEMWGGASLYVADDYLHLAALWEAKGNQFRAAEYREKAEKIQQTESK